MLIKIVDKLVADSWKVMYAEEILKTQSAEITSLQEMALVLRHSKLGIF